MLKLTFPLSNWMSVDNFWEMPGMKKLWLHIKEHPIANKVVAGVILLVLTKIFDTVFSLNIFSSIIGFSSQKYIVPMWGLVLIGIIPGIIILIVYIFHHRQKFIFLEEYGVYKAINSESFFCVICQSPLQKIDDFWYCNKCSRSFGKRTFAKSSGRKVISQGVKSNWMSGVSRW